MLQDQCKPEDKMATATKSKKSSKKASKRTDKKYRNILRNARERLVEDMNVEDVLLDMTSLQVFSETEEENIKATDLTRQQQCEKFLDILDSKGAKAFNSFVEAIGKVQPDLVNLLADIEEGKSVILICFTLQ